MKILIVSPHFPPINAADMQRVRMVLPYLREAGVESTVLATESGIVQAPHDPWLCDGLPADVPIHRAPGLGSYWCRLPGFGTLPRRAMGGLKRLGNRLIGDAISAKQPFDLIYFSTTQFGLLRLGPYWRKRFGVRFVIDYQDPWVNDYYRLHPSVTPPGGRFKYAIAHQLASWAEPDVLRHCSGITSVSPQYPIDLRNKYPFLNQPGRCDDLVVPFPGDVADLERARQDPNVRQSAFDPQDGFKHWVYIGRGGEDMRIAAESFFIALKQFRECEPDLANSIRIHFIGTSYAAQGKGQQTFRPLAQQWGVDDLVFESPDRISYSSTLRCLLDADALLVFGSNDPGYTASKIYPYLLARKPMLAIFHRSSSVVDLIHDVGRATLCAFSGADNGDGLSKDIGEKWFLSSAFAHALPLNSKAFQPYTACAQAKQLKAFFERCLENTRSHFNGSRST